MPNGLGKLKMYSTEFCHLCDAAEEILDAAGINARKIDVVESEELMAKYGTRIPVLTRMDNGAELGWPFDLAAVRRFVA